MERRIGTWEALLAETGFPTSAWMDAADGMSSWRREPDLPWAEWAGGWNAVAYRWRACWDASESFKASVLRDGDAPEQGPRYHQERSLFEFFVSALSVLESYTYSLHAIGAMLKLDGFAMVTEEDRKAVKVKSTVRRFNDAFPDDPLSTVLQTMTSAKEYTELTLLRNTLAHRTQPGRAIVPGGVSTWLGRPIVEATTPTFDWLRDEVGRLLPLTATFVDGHRQRMIEE